MDLVTNILKQLGADGTFVNQLVIILVVFIIAKFLFIDRLQTIIESREAQTVGADEESEKKFKEIDALSQSYKAKIQEANKLAKANIDTSKQQIVKGAEAKYREEEVEVNMFVEKSKKEIAADIQGKEDQILKEADSLSNSLIQKITKG